MIRFEKNVIYYDTFIDAEYRNCGRISVNSQQEGMCRQEKVGFVDLWATFLGRPGGRVTNAVGTIFRKFFVGTRSRPI